MHYRSRLDHALACAAVIILLLSILVVPATIALPISGTNEKLAFEKRFTEETPTRSIFARIFDEWAGSQSRVQVIADMSKPHIKRWSRKRYRGVHH
jgi:hypothetical protein